ncbi:unnamed protein product, partial [Amoebophrya sp. A25]
GCCRRRRRSLSSPERELRLQREQQRRHNIAARRVAKVAAEEWLVRAETSLARGRGFEWTAHAYSDSGALSHADGIEELWQHFAGKIGEHGSRTDVPEDENEIDGQEHRTPIRSANRGFAELEDNGDEDTGAGLGFSSSPPTVAGHAASSSSSS